MKIRLFTRLFLAIFLSLLIPLGVMMASIQWNFRQGFSNYLHEVQLERLGRLAEALGQFYRQHGGWEALRGNRRLWGNLLRQSRGDSRWDVPAPEPPEDFRPPRPPPPGTGFPPPPPPFPHRSGAPLSPGLHVRLLDAQQRIVVGHPPRPMTRDGSPRPSSRLPIKVDGNRVGWLELERNNFITDRLALAFLTQQSRINLLILGLALAAAMIAALILARQLLRPLRRIAAGTRCLASGDFTATIPVTPDELGDLARDFNLLAATLQRNEQARRHWIADISHELRTPLTVLRGEIEALLDGIRQPTPERLASLHGEVMALGKVVEDLYELSLSDLGALTYRRETLNVDEILLEVLDVYQPRFADKAIALEPLIDRSLALLGDRQRLAQLFTNLLENSYRHTDAGGRCRVRLAATADQLTLTLEDSSPGVPEEALAHLFERLYRVDASRNREHGGAGLGLAICRNIVEAHHGAITAEASALGGLLIRVRLPRRLADSGR